MDSHRAWSSAHLCTLLRYCERPGSGPQSIETEQAPDSLASSLGISAQVDECMHNFYAALRFNASTPLCGRTDLQLVDLQLLGANVCLRCGYIDCLFRGNIGDRFNRPHPAEVSILVEGPSSATAFPDLHSPVIAVGRNCENKCNRSRHNHSAQVPMRNVRIILYPLHFPYTLIEAWRHADCLFGRYDLKH
jgi:hypothetical protein